MRGLSAAGTATGRGEGSEVAHVSGRPPCCAGPPLSYSVLVLALLASSSGQISSEKMFSNYLPRAKRLYPSHRLFTLNQ
eukprot:scaffold18856_cov33-Tisochrysis_lutea.AAC.1